jgi:hypothetical protein
VHLHAQRGGKRDRNRKNWRADLTRCGGGGRAVGGEEAGVVGLKRGERISRMRIEKLVSSFWGRDEVLLEGLQ